MSYKPPIHGRDHCLRGADPIPCLGTHYFRAVRYDTDITVGGTTQVTVDWDDWEYTNQSEDIFVPRNTGLGIAVPGEQVRRVDLDIVSYPGRYTFFFGAHPSSAIAGTVELAMHDGDPIWGRPEVALHGANTGLGVGFYALNVSRIYPLYDPFDSGSHTVQVSFTIAQNGGSSEAFDEAVMEIHYQGNIAGDIVSG